MAKRRLAVLIGTKAQFIKTAPILLEMDRRGMPYQLIYTGQHSETFEDLEQAFGTRNADDVLVPGVEAATPGGFLGWTIAFWWQVARRIAMRRWRHVGIGLVHGDTASTLFGALALRLIGVKVVHVEAGLRSPRLLAPFPEELVRRGVSVLSCIHFVPDETAASNLSRVRGLVVNTAGNTLRDALALSLTRANIPSRLGGQGGYAVVSIHRTENLVNSADFTFLMEEVSFAASSMPVKFVLHPSTRAKLHASGWFSRLRRVKNLELLERMDYPDFVRLLLGSACLLSDGGSNQEEAAMLGLPTLLLRRATERPDGLGENVVLSGLDRNVIRTFIARHASASWSIRQIPGTSPSSVIVDTLQTL